MRTLLTTLSTLLLGALLLAPAAHAGVDVEFVNPDDFSDIDNHGNFGSLRPAEVLDVLNHELVTVGARCLPAGQTLALRVTDVRLAGRLGSERGDLRNPDVRLMREIDWPSIHLSWRLLDAAGSELGASTETVSDPSYLWHTAQIDERAPLPYERRMLHAWLVNKFCPDGAAVRP